MVVVTGAAGFIGSHLLAALRAGGVDAVGVDRRPGADVLADLTGSIDDVTDVLREADAVFHLAGCGGVRRSGPDAERTWWRDNVLATEVVLGAVPATTPLVVTSSSSVYGGTRRDRPSDERDRLRPRGGYARSKAEVERRCHARLAKGGHVAVARPFTVAGEGQRADMALAGWIRTAARGEPLPVLGSLDRRRDVTDVADVVRALLAMADRAVTGVVNVGTGVSHTLAELAAAVAAAVRPTGVVVRPASADEAEATRASTARCERLLGFRPRTDLDALVRRQARAALALEEAPAS